MILSCKIKSQNTMKLENVINKANLLNIIADFDKLRKHSINDVPFIG